MNRSNRTWIRRVTALLIVVVVAVIVSMAVQRARRLGRSLPGLDLGPIDLVERAQNIYEGLDFKETVEGKLIFALASERTIGTESGWHEIEGVRLQLYRDGGEGPVLTCDGANFNIQTREARLRGNLSVQFPSGALLSTDAGRFNAKGQLFSTDSEVTFTDGVTFGRAGKAAYSVEDDRLLLTDGAFIRTETGSSLTAQRIVYLRGDGRVQFPDGVRIDASGATLDAPVARVDLDPDVGRPQRIELTGGVTVSTPTGPEGSVVSGFVSRLLLTADAADGWQILGSTDGPWIRMVLQAGDTFFERTLETRNLRGSIGPEGLRNVRAEQGACLREVPLTGPTRTAESDTARLWFEEGSATDVELEGDVVLTGEGLVAEGHRARLAARTGEIVLQGDPMSGGRTTLTSDRALLGADRLRLVDSEGRAEARGHVQGRFVNAGLAGEDAAVSGDVHFAAGSLDATEGGGVFRLQDNARVWQDRQMLVADDIVYRQSPQQLEARGHVRTTFPAREMAGSDPNVSAGDDVVVVARMLDYDRTSGTAIYRGGVRYTDPSHILSSNELTVRFDDEGRIQEADATGRVEIVDMVSGRRMEGDRATRRTDSGVIELQGSPVRLTDEKGNTVSGSSLTWDRASGTVTLAGDTETIYQPEEAP